ncbi:carbohydrate esterase family 1 protein [Acephala macrosclerotiorum]|nr:carbohydrate esterase family 1 protein [Acephala macrosclerotiorum]
MPLAIPRSRLAVAVVLASYFILAEAYTTPGSLPGSAYAGCGKLLPKGQTLGSVTNVSIASGGLQRSYLISIPPRYNAFIPAPLILSYHGGNRDALSQLQLDQLTNPEFNTVSMVVYPQGIAGKWQGVPGVTVDDVQFTTDILNQIESLHCINPSRITATGKSDGAGFCNVLACDPVLSKRMAAFAPVSGAYYIDTLSCNASTVAIPCSAGRKDIPMLAFHGGNDTTIPYLGGERQDECLPTIPHFIQDWAIRDGLGVSNVITPVAVDTVKYSFGRGLETGLVGLYYESNIGHDWPSTQPNSDNTAVGHHVANYNATPIILDFFESHPLSVLETLGEAF